MLVNIWHPASVLFLASVACSISISLTVLGFESRRRSQALKSLLRKSDIHEHKLCNIGMFYILLPIEHQRPCPSELAPLSSILNLGGLDSR